MHLRNKIIRQSGNMKCFILIYYARIQFYFQGKRLFSPVDPLCKTLRLTFNFFQHFISAKTEMLMEDQMLLTKTLQWNLKIKPKKCMCILSFL